MVNASQYLSILQDFGLIYLHEAVPPESQPLGFSLLSLSLSLSLDSIDPCPPFFAYSSPFYKPLTQRFAAIDT